MRSVKRIIALGLACLLMALSLFGCASKGKPLMKLDGSEISVNMFELYLSRMKGMLCTTAYFGNSATKADFWDTWMDVADRTTYNTHYTAVVLDAAKSYLAALALFDERGLKLPNSYIEEIDAEMEELVTNEADGSKTAFNAIIGEYGVNYEMLREAYIIEAKIDYLQDDLFGENGSKIGANLVDEYYKDNYARFKQVFLYSYEYVYETDDNGDVIYYTDNGYIAYDKENGVAKVDGEGNYVTDENGDRIYVYTDEDGKERISYDRDKGVREAVVDSQGEAVVRNYNDTEMEILRAEAQEILTSAKGAEDDMKFMNFDQLVTKHSEDGGMKDYPGGYYVTADTNYEAPKVISSLFEMNVGDVKLIESDYGIHIIMKYELEAAAYTKEENEDLFISTSTGTYMFMDDLVGELLTEYLEPYKARITVDEELLATVDIKRAGINFYY